MSKTMALSAIVLIALFGSSASTGESGKPHRSERPERAVKFHADVLRMTPLEGEIPRVEGASLRMRLITLEPGGHTPFHVHRDRPGIVYVIAGSIVNHEQGKPPKRVAAGEIFYETQGYAHFIENTGAVSATLVSADIVTGAQPPAPK
ncbi:MAG: cupin domain-containing protein [Deltaproteobacteria bacterium]|nr:cupin domain-containing protein [Deltaproteobacteria bacterium]